MRIFFLIFLGFFIFSPLAASAEVASSITSVPTARAQSVTETHTVPPTSVDITTPPAPSLEHPLAAPMPTPAEKAGEQKSANQSAASKGELVQWRNAYVSGVSANIITVVVATKQRRKSYEPVMITPTTKILRGSKPATLGDIKIRQYVSVRGYRNGDIVNADEFVIGGRLSRDPISPARKGVKSRKTTPKRAAPVPKKKPVKVKRSR